MATIQLNIPQFRAMFPAFTCSNTPDLALQGYFAAATDFADDCIYPCTNVKLQTSYLNYMTAHLAALSQMISSGETPGVVTGSTIDKISVTLLPPPTKNAFDYWMNLTPYGQQLLALLKVQSVGGFAIGFRAPLAGFRKSFGGF